MKIKHFLPLALIALNVCACRNQVQQDPEDHSITLNHKKESLLKINNYVARRNSELVSQFVRRTGLEFVETGTGLWYYVYSREGGKGLSGANKLELQYELSFLDGTPIDSLHSAKPMVFIPGKGDVVPGIEEAVALLHEGDKAYLILPPHLGYGNFGDGEKIPPGAFLFYNITRIKILQ